MNLEEIQNGFTDFFLTEQIVIPKITKRSDDVHEIDTECFYSQFGSGNHSSVFLIKPGMIKSDSDVKNYEKRYQGRRCITKSEFNKIIKDAHQKYLLIHSKTYKPLIPHWNLNPLIEPLPFELLQMVNQINTLEFSHLLVD
jgi:hypothetical protein